MENILAILFVQLAATIFGAGKIYSKIGDIERRIEKIELHDSDIAAIKAKVEIIQKKVMQ